jgi:hypothetical protein
MHRVLLALIALTLGSSAFARDSVVIGRGISNSFLSKVDCPVGTICLDAQYLWVLISNRTVVGPPVEGQIRAISMQHTDAIQQFVTSVELFVLRPIESATIRSSSGADFYIVALSPRDPAGRYCLSVNPATVGLHLDPTRVRAAGGSYCFDAQSL